MGKNKATRREVPKTVEAVIRARRIRIRQKATIKAFFFKLVVLLVTMYLLFFVFFGVTAMGSNDMKPTLRAGDLLLYYRLKEEYLAGDLVVYEVEGKERVGRVVAVGGDVVEITEDNVLRINGSSMIETDIYYSTPPYEDSVPYPLTVPEGSYFILCDYRDGGKDSRYFGAIATDQIEGQIISAIRRSQL